MHFFSNPFSRLLTNTLIISLTTIFFIPATPPALNIPRTYIVMVLPNPHHLNLTQEQLHQLIATIENDNAETITQLLNLNSPISSNGIIALLEVAAQIGHNNAFDALRTNRIKPITITVGVANELLLRAVHGANEAIVKTLIQTYHADVNYEDTKALKISLKRNYAKIANLLIAHGAHCTHPRMVYAAAKSNNPDLLSLLILKGADINQSYSDDNLTPLMAIAHKNDAVGLKLLLDHGASTTVKDRTGNIALSYAIINASPDTTDLLLEHNAQQLNHRDTHNQPLLVYLMLAYKHAIQEAPVPGNQEHYAQIIDEITNVFGATLGQIIFHEPRYKNNNGELLKKEYKAFITQLFSNRDEQKSHTRLIKTVINTALITAEAERENKITAFNRTIAAKHTPIISPTWSSKKRSRDGDLVNPSDDEQTKLPDNNGSVMHALMLREISY